MKVVIGALAVLLFVQASSASPISGRITDGEDAQPGQFPHQVSIQWGFPPFIPLSHVCGGSILSENYVLTAGHCVTEVPKLGKYVVKVGKHHVSKDDVHVQTVKVSKKIVHEDFPGNVAPNDIALLKLATPLQLNDRVRVIALPEKDSVQSGEVVLSGWGSTSKNHVPKMPSILQTATLPVIPYDRCLKAVKDLSDTPLFETQMCTGPLDGTTSACSGDSGGPLIQYVDEVPVLVGVVSWGMFPCGSVGAPSVYTRVSSFIDWIKSHAK